MTDKDYCERHQDGKVTITIPQFGMEQNTFNPVSHHRPKGFYEAIKCPSCRIEQKNYDESFTYFPPLRKTERPVVKKTTVRDRLKKKLEHREKERTKIEDK